MYLSAEDAKSDVILAGAATVFGDLLLSLVLSAPFIPVRGIGLGLVVIAAAFALSGLVPVLLARYRDDVPGAFALGSGGVTTGAALLLAAPVVVVGFLGGLLVTGEPVTALLGRVAGTAALLPTLGAAPLDVATIVLALLEVIVYAVGTLLLVGFLTVRGRDAWRSDDRNASQLLRVVGLGAAAVALVLGSFRALAAGGGFLSVLLNVVAVAVVVLVADRAVPAGATVERGAVATPVVLFAVAHLFASGGLFSGGLLDGLYRGGLAAGVTVAVAVTIDHGRRGAVVLPLIVAAQWFPTTCLGPLPFSLVAC